MKRSLQFVPFFEGPFGAATPLTSSGGQTESEEDFALFRIADKEGEGAREANGKTAVSKSRINVGTNCSRLQLQKLDLTSGEGYNNFMEHISSAMKDTHNTCIIHNRCFYMST